MIRPFLIDLNPVELKYYPFMINLDKLRGSGNSVDDLSTKICFPNKTKDINIKVFNMLTNKNKVKTRKNILYVTANANSIRQLAIQTKIE